MYPQISAAQVENLDKYGNQNAIAVGAILSEFSRNVVSDLFTGGSTGTTVTKQFFVAPAKMKITRARLLIDVAVTGTGNVPVITLQNGSTVLATITSDVADSPAAGDVVEGVLTETVANLTIDTGTALKLVITTPSETITTPIQGKVQMEYNTVN